MRAPRPLNWFGATVLGYAIGTTVSVLGVGALARPLSPALGGIVFILVFGAVIGLCVGALQLAAIPRGAVRVGEWMVGLTLGAAIGFLALAVVGEVLGDFISPTGSIVIGGGTIEITSGAVAGLAIGFAQWRVMRGAIGSPRAWTIASVLGTGLGYGAAAAALELLEVPVLKANLIPAFGAIVGILVGLAQAVVLSSIHTNTRSDGE